MDESKICTNCSQNLPLTAFARNSRKTDGLQQMCRACKKTYNAEYYRLTKHIHNPARIARTREIRAQLRAQIIEYLKTHPCVDCGETDIIVLQFDHLRDKITDISTMMNSAFSWTKIQREIEKCDVVCANDHMRRTARRSMWAKVRVDDTPL